MNKPGGSWHVVVAVYNLIREMRSHFFLQTVFILILQILGISAIFLFSHMVNNLFIWNKSELLTAIAIWIGNSVLMSLFSFVQSIHKDRYLNIQLSRTTRNYTLSKLFDLNIQQLEQDSAGYKYQVVTRGEAAIENFVNSVFSVVLPVLTFALLALFGLFFQTWAIAIFSLISVFTIGITTFFFKKSNFSIFTENRDLWIDDGKKFQSILSNLAFVRSFAREKFSTLQYFSERSKAELTQTKYKKALSLQFLARGLMQHISEIAALAYCMVLINDNELKLGSLYIVYNLNTRFFAQISTLNSVVSDYPAWLSNIEKYLSYLNRQLLFSEHGENKKITGQIHFKNVSFTYPSHSQPTLKNISFEIAAGSKIALVGDSGSGKSTILKLLLKAYQIQQGEIQIGHSDINSIDSVNLRNQICYLSQDCAIPYPTIKKNIEFSLAREINFETDSTAIKNAFQNSQFNTSRVQHSKNSDQKMQSEHHFYSFDFGENAAFLSGGEKQRFFVAMALLKNNAQIYLFDEITSGLDQKTEAELLRALNQTLKSKTVVVTTHRSAALSFVDKIYFIRNGELIAEGTHEELLGSNSEYRKLLAMKD